MTALTDDTVDAGWDDGQHGPPCRTCGFTSAHLDVSGSVAALKSVVERWGQLLDSTPTALARMRTADSAWSTLERAGQVRDILHVKAKRLERLRDQDHPGLEEVDFDAPRAGDNDLAPYVVGAAITCTCCTCCTSERLGSRAWWRGR